MMNSQSTLQWNFGIPLESSHEQESMQWAHKDSLLPKKAEEYAIFYGKNIARVFCDAKDSFK